MQLGELQGAMCLFDVTEDDAGSDGGELLIITDQPDTRAMVDDERDCVSRDKGSAMPASSMMINVAGPTPVAQSGSPPFRSDQASAG